MLTIIDFKLLDLITRILYSYPIIACIWLIPQSATARQTFTFQFRKIKLDKKTL